jgi:cysteine dioxygenase
MQSCAQAEAILPPGRRVESLYGLFAELAAYESVPSVSELIDLVCRNPIALDDIHSVVAFDAETYTRTRLFESAHCEVLLLAWLPGQRSKIHDHGGSGGAVRVVSGEVAETRFEINATGRADARESIRRGCGAVIEEQPFDVHQLANSSTRDALVTLHVFAPPLRHMRTYVEADDAAVAGADRGSA